MPFTPCLDFNSFSGQSSSICFYHSPNNLSLKDPTNKVFVSISSNLPRLIASLSSIPATSFFVKDHSLHCRIVFDLSGTREDLVLPIRYHFCTIDHRFSFLKAPSPSSNSCPVGPRALKVSCIGLLGHCHVDEYACLTRMLNRSSAELFSNSKLQTGSDTPQRGAASETSENAALFHIAYQTFLLQRP